MIYLEDTPQNKEEVTTTTEFHICVESMRGWSGTIHGSGILGCLGMQQSAYQHSQPPPTTITSSFRTIGDLEIKARINQVDRSVILDTGACVSCIDESLVAHLRDKISPG